MNPVLQNDFKRQWLETREAAMSAFARVGESGWYILGGEVRAFEEALARLWGRRHAVGVASGLDAIEIALKILGCGRGDRVLTTPLSAFATTLAVVKLGAIPVFVDTDEFGLIDLQACRDVLRDRNDIRFILPVHLYGFALNLQELAALCRDFGCRLVEDCAQSVGASFDGGLTGSVGDLAATSFYPTKNLGAVGDGGAILCDDPAYAERAAVLRNYGQSAKYRHNSVGYNSRLDEFQAALLRSAHLPKLEEWTERRRAVAARYLAALCGKSVRPVGVPPGSNPVWHLFPVLVEPQKKSDFLRCLSDNGIVSGEHYPVTIIDQPAMAEIPHEVIGTCSRARKIAQSEVSLPVHPHLTEEEVSHVISVCQRWEGGCSR